MSLNPEPSAPEERDAQQLPPKSYADAAEEALEPESHANIHVDGAAESHLPQAKETTNGIKPNGIKPNGIDTKPNGIDILRIVPAAETNGNDAHDDDNADNAHDANEDQSRDRVSYEGAGTDETPKSPVPKGSRKKGSRSSLGSIGRTQGSIGRTQGVRIGSHGHEKSHSNSSSSSDGSIAGLANGNGTTKIEGDTLTTVKPTMELEKESQPERQLQRRNSELKAGRQAGAGWATSKIRFAPMNVPLQRRLQTLAVLMHTLSIVGGLAIFFFLCSIPLLWPILLPYTVYVLFSNAGTSGELSFRSERLRRLPVWSLFASYFPARLHRSQELEPTRKYIFGYHPHGIISHGAFAAFATEALGFSQLFPGITNALLTLDSNFRYPIYREYALRLGMASVSRESCENILSKGGHNGEGMGRAITIVVGGARESLDARPGSIRLVLRRRKGFVKMAIRTGADLVPVLAFGENDVYDQVDSESHPLIHKFQMLVKKVMGFTVPLFHARGVFNYDVGMMPYRRPINIVVGKPIRVVQNSNPDGDYMDEVHSKYISELMRLWEEHKDTFAKQRTGELEIVE